MNPYKQMKKDQKALASQIREMRKSGEDWKRVSLSRRFRHYHIAYCELRGRQRDQIECKTRDDNKADEKWIEKIKNQFFEDMNKFEQERVNGTQENVCACA